MPDSINPRVLAEIKRQHGSVIDLNKSPHVILDIIRDFHPVVIRGDDDGGGGAPGSPPSPPGEGGGHGAPGSPPSPPGGDGGGGAPGSPPTPPPPRGPDDRELGMSTMLNLILDMKRDLGALHAKIDKQQR
ncbi:hypothetical protein AB2M62_12000 [Sphingomonas sp. MMS12-HWE2-04]|uniref:hypothetical protein n=1 Tax=Sphingomonas sp. MMS12-HWE2-04 TaxID=3234199 RepID=UPI00384ACD6F